MRILHITPSYKPAYVYGGPIMSVSKLCESLSSIPNIHLTVITTNANGKTNLEIPLHKEINVEGVTVIYFKRISGDPHHVSPSLWRYLGANTRHYDVIHIHSWWNLLSVVAAMICVVKKKKIVISPRGMLSDYIFETGSSQQKRRLHKWIGKYLLSKSSFHATSDLEHEECKKLIHGWKGFTIPNIIHLPSIEIVEKKNAIFTLGFLSRIDPKKGIEFVFTAIKALPFPVVFTIAGEGEEHYINQLKALASQLGIEKNIEWAGWKNVDDKFYELMNFDLFMLTSFNENFANAVVEALYMGTPVCISKQVGLAHFVDKHQLGWITDLTVPSVQDAIYSSYTNSDKRKQIETSAREIILSEFSPPVVIQQYLNMYTIISKQNKNKKER